LALAAQKFEAGGAEEQARTLGIDAEGFRAGLGQEFEGGEREKRERCAPRHAFFDFVIRGLGTVVASEKS
jgi:hypothetical protein